MKKCNFTISDFYCTNCNQKGISIPRRANKAREKGHLKVLYCIHCKGEYNHVEVRSFDSDFFLPNESLYSQIKLP